MAKNTGEGYRNGSVNNRTQMQNPRTGLFQVRDRDTGQFMRAKVTGGDYKGIAHEVDGRRK